MTAPLRLPVLVRAPVREAPAGSPVPCMTVDEYAGWDAANAVLSQRAASPCEDCPLAFHVEMLAEGRCNGAPTVRTPGRPAPARDWVPQRGRRYATEEERVAARRESWRRANRRRRNGSEAVA